jgi:hypothetical protein
MYDHLHHYDPEFDAYKSDDQQLLAEALAAADERGYSEPDVEPEPMDDVFPS